MFSFSSVLETQLRVFPARKVCAFIAANIVRDMHDVLCTFFVFHNNTQAGRQSALEKRKYQRKEVNDKKAIIGNVNVEMAYVTFLV